MTHQLIVELQKEQIEVRQRLIEANRGLMWEDTRNMPFTNRVSFVFPNYMKCGTFFF